MNVFGISRQEEEQQLKKILNVAQENLERAMEILAKGIAKYQREVMKVKPHDLTK